MRNQETLNKFTSLHLYKQKKGKKDEKGEDFTLDIGRAWRTEELWMKSNEDLKKLWYVFLREKNSILSDDALYKRTKGEELPGNRLAKINKSMTRLENVLDERKKIKEKYQRYLENQYTKKKKEEYSEVYKKQLEEEENNPKITYELLKDKYRELQRGVDDVNYLERYIKKKKAKKEYLDYLRKKYDYRNKRVINPERVDKEQLESLRKNDENIVMFKNQIQEQLKENKTKISQEEVLRSHVKNWKMLNLKQRRVVTNFINARRSRDAKSEFRRELDLLSQKIAYENKQMALKNKSESK